MLEKRHIIYKGLKDSNYQVFSFLRFQLLRYKSIDGVMIT